MSFLSLNGVDVNMAPPSITQPTQITKFCSVLTENATHKEFEYSLGQCINYYSKDAIKNKIVNINTGKLQNNGKSVGYVVCHAFDNMGYRWYGISPDPVVRYDGFNFDIPSYMWIPAAYIENRDGVKSYLKATTRSSRNINNSTMLYCGRRILRLNVDRAMAEGRSSNVVPQCVGGDIISVEFARNQKRAARKYLAENFPTTAANYPKPNVVRVDARRMHNPKYYLSESEIEQVKNGDGYIYFYRVHTKEIVNISGIDCVRAKEYVEFDDFRLI